MILPIGADSFSEALRYGAEIYHHLKVQKKLDIYYNSLIIVWWISNESGNIDVFEVLVLECSEKGVQVSCSS
jgi:hypothetical protein